MKHTASASAICQTRNKVLYVLSLDTKLVRKYFSCSNTIEIAFGMILAVLSL